MVYMGVRGRGHSKDRGRVRKERYAARATEKARLEEKKRRLRPGESFTMNGWTFTCDAQGYISVDRRKRKRQ